MTENRKNGDILSRKAYNFGPRNWQRDNDWFWKY